MCLIMLFGLPSFSRKTVRREYKRLTTFLSLCYENCMRSMCYEMGLNGAIHKTKSETRTLDVDYARFSDISSVLISHS